MNKKEEIEFENKIEKILESGKYAEVRIVIDAENPREPLSCVRAKNVGPKDFYSLILSLRETEKQIFNSKPELRLLDMFNPYTTKSKIVHNSEDSIMSKEGKLMKEIGKRLNDKKKDSIDSEIEKLAEKMTENFIEKFLDIRGEDDE